MAGVSAAYHLARVGFKDILLIDALPPLSLTSDRSTECYRNWWPDAEMVALMNRSIDLMQGLAEQSGNVFRMNHRGYLFVTADDSGLSSFTHRAAAIAALGAGPLRVHSTATSDYHPAGPDRLEENSSGADLLLNADLIRRHFPCITEGAVAALHVRRAGWLSAQQLGACLLERARDLGVAVLSANIEGVRISGDRVQGLQLNSGERIDCPLFVNAAGPYLKQVGAMMGIAIPVRTELHLKVTIKDHLCILPRDAPLLIWQDPQLLPWESDERLSLLGEESTRWLTEPLPPGVHVRPEGSGESQTILMLWDYKSRWMEPLFPAPLDDLYPEVALRGLSTMLPGLQRYFGRVPRPFMDGGYYVKTPENRLLAGPLPVKGAYVIGGLSGHGIMSACAAGELLAAHMAGSDLPAYAPAFSLDRYTNREYRAKLANWGEDGQL